MKDRKVAIVGAGYIGAVLAGVLCSKDRKVVALDKNPKIVKAISEGKSPVREPGLDELISGAVTAGRLSASLDFAEVAKCEVILITVGTPLTADYSADTDMIDSVVAQLMDYVSDDQIVIVKSTVPPNTTQQNVATPLRLKAPGIGVAFCPERLAEGNAISECLTIPVVVGGVDADSTYRASNFWRGIGMEVISVADARTAELVKLADNAWIDLNIAISFELAKLADNLDIDVLQVIDAANTLPKGQHYVNILKPSIGVGGYCLTKDPWFLDALAKEYGGSFKTAVASRTVNDEAPKYSARKIVKKVEQIFPAVDRRQIKLGVLGLSFKNDTGDCRYTPTLPAVQSLQAEGFSVSAYDPWISDEDWKLFSGVKRAESVGECLKGAHVVAFLSGHSCFRDLNWESLASDVNARAIIFDGRMFFSSNEIRMIEGLNLNFIGVGR